MRWALLVLIAGCGRMSFDPVAAVGPTADAPKLLIDAPMLSLDAGECPATYMLLGTSCYRVGPETKDWLAAELACEANAVGAHLVVFDGGSEQALIAATFGTAIRTWIGTSKRQVAAYRTVIDTPPFLDLGVPQTEPTEDCVSVDTDGHMYLHSCPDKNRFVCEFDGHPAVPAAF